jgi:hypothetical protein
MACASAWACWAYAYACVAWDGAALELVAFGSAVEPWDLSEFDLAVTLLCFLVWKMKDRVDLQVKEI